MKFHRLNIIAGVFFSMAAVSPSSLLAQGDMGPIGIVVLEDMIREQNPPDYGYQTMGVRQTFKHRSCRKQKIAGCRRGIPLSKAN